MKSKRRLLALLLSAVIFWQGFSVVNAEDASTASGSTVSSSSSTVGGESRAAAREIPDAVQSVEMTLDNKPVDANTKRRIPPIHLQWSCTAFCSGLVSSL